LSDATNDNPATEGPPPPSGDAPSPAVEKLKVKVERKARAGRRRPNLEDLDAVTIDGVECRLGQPHPKHGRLILSTRQAHPTALAVMRTCYEVDGVRMLQHYAGDWWRWQKSHYAMVEPPAIAIVVTKALREALEVVEANNSYITKPYPVTPTTVDAIVKAMSHDAHLSVDQHPACFLGEPPADERGKPVEATDMLCLKSQMLHVPTGALFPATPLMFNTSALAFDYDPDNVACPAWEAFLKSVFKDDIEQVQTLREFMGLLLVHDTSFQKALMIIGQPASGKGTIAWVIENILGKNNIASPSTSSLSSNFGKQVLIGKSLAMLTDARFSGHDVMKAIEDILRIVGEDPVDIDRKHRPAITLRLGVRLLLTANKVPNLPESSDALGRRFIILETQDTFVDREDYGLKPRLKRELPAILNWALDGLHRLRDRGYFVEPASTKQLKKEFIEIGQPIKRFANDCVIFTNDENDRVATSALYEKYKSWCANDESKRNAMKSTFMRDWNNTFKAFKAQQTRRIPGEAKCVNGIRLRSDYGLNDD